MSLKRFVVLASAGVVFGGLIAGVTAQDSMMAAGEFIVDPAIAAMSPEELVELRQDKMREDGSILRGASTLSGDAAVAAAQTLVINFANFPAMFPEGSIVGDSKALPVIWENWDGFTAIFEKARLASADALGAAQAGDMAAFQAALQPIGETCGECHQTYRAPAP